MRAKNDTKDTENREKRDSEKIHKVWRERPSERETARVCMHVYTHAYVWRLYISACMCTCVFCILVYRTDAQCKHVFCFTVHAVGGWGGDEGVALCNEPPLPKMAVCFEWAHVYLGSDINITTAQRLYALDLAGFSGHAGSIPSSVQFAMQQESAWSVHINSIKFWPFKLNLSILDFVNLKTCGLLGEATAN